MLGGGGNGVDNWTEASSVRSRRSRSRSHSRNRKENRRPSSADSSVESRSHRRYALFSQLFYLNSKPQDLFFFFVVGPICIIGCRDSKKKKRTIKTKLMRLCLMFSLHKFDLNIEIRPKEGALPDSRYCLLHFPFYG